MGWKKKIHLFFLATFLRHVNCRISAKNATRKPENQKKNLKNCQFFFNSQRKMIMVVWVDYLVDCIKWINVFHYFIIIYKWWCSGNSYWWCGNSYGFRWQVKQIFFSFKIVINFWLKFFVVWTFCLNHVF